MHSSPLHWLPDACCSSSLLSSNRCHDRHISVGCFFFLSFSLLCLVPLGLHKVCAPNEWTKYQTGSVEIRFANFFANGSARTIVWLCGFPRLHEYPWLVCEQPSFLFCNFALSLCVFTVNTRWQQSCYYMLDGSTVVSLVCVL